MVTSENPGIMLLNTYYNDYIIVLITHILG